MNEELPIGTRVKVSDEYKKDFRYSVTFDRIGMIVGQTRDKQLYKISWENVNKVYTFAKVYISKAD